MGERVIVAEETDERSNGRSERGERSRRNVFLRRVRPSDRSAATARAADSVTHMAKPDDIDPLLRSWEYVPGEIQSRLVHARDGREILQVRVDLGVLQLEIKGRPDGLRPQGAASFYDHLVQEQIRLGEKFTVTAEHEQEIDREFLQYYQRRVCWLALRKFGLAVEDADHNLALLDFIVKYAPDQDWVAAHEQYRPFILFHRIQADALARLESDGPEDAIQRLNDGLEGLKRVFAAQESDELFDENEMVQRLVQLRDVLKREYAVGPTLEERLAEAVRNEDYELAAKLRDEINRRSPPAGH